MFWQKEQFSGKDNQDCFCKLGLIQSIICAGMRRGAIVVQSGNNTPQSFSQKAVRKFSSSG